MQIKKKSLQVISISFIKLSNLNFANAKGSAAVAWFTVTRNLDTKYFISCTKDLFLKMCKKCSTADELL